VFGREIRRGPGRDDCLWREDRQPSHGLQSIDLRLPVVSILELAHAVARNAFELGRAEIGGKWLELAGSPGLVRGMLRRRQRRRMRGKLRW